MQKSVTIMTRAKTIKAGIELIPTLIVIVATVIVIVTGVEVGVGVGVGVEAEVEAEVPNDATLIVIPIMIMHTMIKDIEMIIDHICEI